MDIQQPLLKVDNLSKSFMGVKAVDDLSFNVPKGKIIGLIGPNGAGKSTAFNLISKLYKPDQGQVFLNGKSIIDLKVYEVNKLGIARTFQNIRLLADMSVLDNIMVSLGNQSKYSILDVITFRGAYRRDEARNLEIAHELLKKTGDLYAVRNDKAGSLPYGKQRQLEIVRALATNPQILLMDEPAAGMIETEKQYLKEYIESIISEGTAVLLIEHDMNFVMDMCEHIIVLNFGKKIAEGNPDSIQSNECVIEAYLGRRKTC